MARYIDADKLDTRERGNNSQMTMWREIQRIVDNAPTADVVEVEKYNELREAFVDFVCSGVHNPAPYCKNRCDECVDARGWCTYRRCNGFNPDGERSDDNG